MAKSWTLPRKTTEKSTSSPYLLVTLELISHSSTTTLVKSFEEVTLLIIRLKKKEEAFGETWKQLQDSSS